MAECGAACGALVDERLVDEGTAALVVANVPLGLEDAEQRLDGVVGDGRLAREAPDDVGNGAFAAVPEHAHQPQLAVGERDGALPGHKAECSVPRMARAVNECISTFALVVSVPRRTRPRCFRWG